APRPTRCPAVGALRLDDLYIGFRKLIDKPRRCRRLPEPAVAPVLDEAHLGPPAGAGEADVGQPALLLEARLAVLVEAALVGEQPLLPARQEHDVELQPLGGV